MKIRDTIRKLLPRQAAFQRDPATITRLQPLLNALSRYYRADVRGEERVPDGPCLLVANHSGGLYTPEAYVIVAWWLRTQGTERPVYLLAHDLLFVVPLIGRLARRSGVIPASRENAIEAFERGGAVLVFPGGDFEAFRPFGQRGRVDFGERRGFIKLALEAGVPVVPIVSHGSHDTTFVLFRGERLAKALRLDRIRTKILPVVMGLPWIVAPGFIPFFPWPARITVQILKPLTWGLNATPSPQTVTDLYESIVGMMQDTLSDLVIERPFPLFA